MKTVLALIETVKFNTYNSAGSFNITLDWTSWSLMSGEKRKKFCEKSCDIKLYEATQLKLIINPLTLPRCVKLREFYLNFNRNHK